MPGSRRAFLQTAAACCASACIPSLASAEDTTARNTFRFGVLSLFHPQRLTITPSSEAVLTLGNNTLAVSPSDRIELSLTASSRIAVHMPGAIHQASSVDLSFITAAPFTIAVPPPAMHGTITRRFTGQLQVVALHHTLQPIVSINAEDAVASIVAAESPPGAHAAYLEAQAIAARSFLYGGGPAPHAAYDFCDTTHCQFMQALPAPHTAAREATDRTVGQCLFAAGAVLRALYSRSCSGRTHTLAELGLTGRSGYPYYAVPCHFCRIHPERWSRPAEGLPSSGDERSRIQFNRIYGWSALPSPDFKRTGDRVHSAGIGHGIGMCQRGAEAMASSGASALDILQHYYPNTTTASVQV